MGGGCSSRETCSDYQSGYGSGIQEEKYISIVERLCGKEEEPASIQRVACKENETKEKSDGKDRKI
jgi:hypothetical protein